MFRKRRTAKHQARFDLEQAARIELGQFMSRITHRCMCCDAVERSVADVLSAMGLELSPEGVVQHAYPRELV